MTPWAEVIGDPIAHSKSPAIHNHWLAALGLPGRYQATRVAPAELAAYFEGRRRAEGWRGCNVTIPHKECVVPLLDRLAPSAAPLGAANIVLREGDALVGHNSDRDGFLEPLQPRLATGAVSEALVLGAGGAARAVVAALSEAGVRVQVAARRRGQAEALLADLRVPDGEAIELDVLASPPRRPATAQLLVNATPLGMTGQPRLAFDLAHLRPDALVYDLVYQPLETPLLAEARRCGHPTIDGLAMLIGQAAVAFALFFDRPAPRERDDELRMRLTS